MDIKIRKYSDTDYNSCVTLSRELAEHHAVIYEDPSIAEKDFGRVFTEYLNRSDRHDTWVAEIEGRVVGLVGLLDVIGETGVAEIEPLVITADVRDRGIGSKLVEYVKDAAKKAGYRFISIKPELRNEEAFKLYVRLGFNLVGQVELFQDLLPERGRKWQSGVEILGHKLRY